MTQKKQTPPRQSPEITNYESLNKFLMGTLAMIRRKEINLDEAEKIAQVSDKIIKNNLTAIMEKKRLGDDTPLDYFQPSDKQVLIG